MKIFFSDGFSSWVSVFVTLLLSLTSGLFGVNRMSMQRIGLQMRSVSAQNQIIFFCVTNWMCGVRYVWKHAKACVTQRNRESWQLCKQASRNRPQRILGLTPRLECLKRPAEAPRLLMRQCWWQQKRRKQRAAGWRHKSSFKGPALIAHPIRMEQQLSLLLGCL